MEVGADPLPRLGSQERQDFTTWSVGGEVGSDDPGIIVTFVTGSVAHDAVEFLKPKLQGGISGKPFYPSFEGAFTKFQ